MYTVTSMYTSQHVYTDSNSNSKGVHKSRRTHMDNMNNSTVSNSIYSSGGPMGRPLYPQLSGHCNRPFPRDSRVFTRRLTPNLVCSRSHTKSRARSHKNYAVEQSRRNNHEKRLQNNCTMSYGTHGHKTKRYTGVYIGWTRASPSTDDLSIYQSGKAYA